MNANNNIGDVAKAMERGEVLCNEEREREYRESIEAFRKLNGDKVAIAKVVSDLFIFAREMKKHNPELVGEMVGWDF